MMTNGYRTACQQEADEAHKEARAALAALWDHFAVPAILETLRVAELAGIDISGSLSFYATASNGQVGSTSIGPAPR